MPVVRSTESRRTETPNATMTTLASPTQGDSVLSVWRVDMRPGQAGPPHTMSTEQVWTVLTGGATVSLGADTMTVEAGDTLVLPAGIVRRLSSHPNVGLAAIVAAPAGGLATAADDVMAEAAEACAVRTGDAVAPAWLR